MKIERVGLDQVYIEYRHAGHYVRRAIGFDALTEFLEGAALKETNLGSKGVVLFDKFCEEWYLLKSAKHRLKPRTFLREAEGVKALNKHFGAMPLHKVQMGDWENYKLLRFSGKYSLRGKVCSDGTVKKEFRILRSVLAYAVLLGFIRSNVLSGFKSGLSDGNRSDIWLTKDEFAPFSSSLRTR